MPMRKGVRNIIEHTGHFGVDLGVLDVGTVYALQDAAQLACRRRRA